MRTEWGDHKSPRVCKPPFLFIRIGFEQQIVNTLPNRRVGRGMTLLIYQILAIPLSHQQHLTCNLFPGFDILLLGKYIYGVLFHSESSPFLRLSFSFRISSASTKLLFLPHIYIYATYSFFLNSSSFIIPYKKRM